MGIEGLLSSVSGLFQNLWEYVDRHMFCEWFWNISGIGKLTKCGSVVSSGDLYWTSLVAAVRIDKSYFDKLPARVQQTARWLIVHGNKEKGKEGKQ